MSSKSSTIEITGYAWRALRIYNLYRLLLAVLLLSIFWYVNKSIFLGTEDPDLYLFAAWTFLLLTVFSIASQKFYQKHFLIQVEIQAFFDILLITLMMHASGGVLTGLGVLLAISASATCILTGHTSSLTFAALATVAVIGEEIYSNLSGLRQSSGLTQAGILGLTFFITSLLAFFIAKRAKESERKAEVSSRGLADMEELNDHIIEYMTIGVLVVDERNEIIQINKAAWMMLGMPDHSEQRLLKTVNAQLNRQLHLWKSKKGFVSSTFKSEVTGPSILPRFTSVGVDKSLSIIFLEDTSEIHQQAQNLKLASLGRLTASIAHEIRNPLGALSHAAQLLKESPFIPDDDKGLIDIIENNSIRMNTIIENIMQLSQRKPSQLEPISLNQFLPNFIGDFKIGHEPEPEIQVNISSSTINVNFDVSQLTQIVTNLCENGLRYSEEKTGKATVAVVCDVDFHQRSPFIDIIDQGKGVDPKIAENIFEPFFTTSRKGSGLGLYLARELCEANGARLDYIPIPSGGSCFRISFANKSLSDNEN